ncbi:P-loop containing nucleoside triphosphate hydrolase protein, partial [Aureobasidium melanogenum]
MSDSSSPSASLAESTSDAKRVEDDVLIESPKEDEVSDEVPDAEKDTVVVESLDTDDNEVFKLRAYQAEMLAESLTRNTIIVLNTGAGKTHIALARARAELESEQSDKLVWFLAPTVALCHQYYRIIEEVLMSRKTYCTDQLRALRKRAEVIARDISPAAAETYIQACRDKFLAGIQENDALWMPELLDKEKSHLAEILTNLHVDSVTSDTTVSLKLQLLLDILREESESSFTGIIFVEQRAVVAALAEYLTSDPERSQIFNIGTFVGGSNSSKKKANIGDINDLKAQQQTLDDFRIGKKNLIIATSVLEEGIDISSCQTVICFDAPLNLVSFVQRRGRARKKDSKYIILLADDDDKGEPAKWNQLEDRMKAAYEDEYRNAQLAAQLEQIHESEDRKQEIQSTGALLTLDNAKSHLNHFCATLQTANHVDHRPVFECRTAAEDLITAKVLLPSSVSQRYRTAVSAHSWKTERAAMKDAAFQACVALHRGGLLNDHLLPPHIQTPDQARQNRPGLTKVATKNDPWELHTSDSWFRHVVELEIEGQPSTSMEMFLPVECPRIEDITLYWSMHITGVAKIGPGQPCKLGEEEADQKQKDTETMLLSVLTPADLATAKGRYAAMFEPLDQSSMTPLSRKSRPAIEQLSVVQNTADVGLVQVNVQQGRSYVFQSIQGQDQQILEVTRFPRKRDFLTRPAEESKKNRLTRETLAMSQCTINILPARYSFFAACIPSLLHTVETVILAARLRDTVLKPVGIKNLQLIIEATTSGAADFTASYEKLEYLGDAVLKYCTHVQLAAQHPEWPESYLTAEKGRTNGNASLSRAALSSGVDRFISTMKFTGNHWKPPTICTDQKDKNEKTVDRSTKTLADVVEALVGASYIDQGLEGALACIRIFLPNEQWLNHTMCLSSLLTQTPVLSKIPPFIDTVEKLIDYKFANPSLLLEALTHSSFPSPEALSYERLEFLGDAILDQILIPSIFSATPPLKNHEMHRMRQALANAHILGICCLELSFPAPRLEPTTTETGEVALQETVHLHHLHDFMRCGASVHIQRKAALDRYTPLRTQILEQLEHGHEYPWPDLLRLGLHKSCKWMSDILESVLGAIYIDSSGNLSACKAFVEKLGLFKLLDRFLDEGVQVAFPRERLGLMANQKDVEYRPSNDGNGEWSCKIFVGQKEVVDVGGCVSREEAEARGAATAVRVLQEEIIRGMESVAIEGGEDEEMADAE